MVSIAKCASVSPGLPAQANLTGVHSNIALVD